MAHDSRIVRAKHEFKRVDEATLKVGRSKIQTLIKPLTCVKVQNEKILNFKNRILIDFKLNRSPPSREFSRHIISERII